MSSVEEDNRREEFVRKIAETDGPDLYRLEFALEAAWAGLEEFLKELYEYLDANDLCATVSFNSLLPEALDILLERCYYLRPEGLRQRFEIRFDTAVLKKLFYEERVEGTVLSKSVQKKRRVFWSLSLQDGRNLTGSEDLEELFSLTVNQIDAIKQGKWLEVAPLQERLEKLEEGEELRPCDLPARVSRSAFLATERGIVYRGTLLHYVVPLERALK